MHKFVKCFNAMHVLYFAKRKAISINHKWMAILSNDTGNVKISRVTVACQCISRLPALKASENSMSLISYS